MCLKQWVKDDIYKMRGAQKEKKQIGELNGQLNSLVKTVTQFQINKEIDLVMIRRIKNGQNKLNDEDWKSRNFYN